MKQGKTIPAKGKIKKREPLKNGAKAPAFSLPMFGREFVCSFPRQSDHKDTVSLDAGKKTLLVIVQPHCAPCAMFLSTQLPAVQREHPELSVVVVSSGDYEANLNKFGDPGKLPFPVGIEPKDMPVSRAYAIQGTPASYLIDEAGVLVDASGFAANTLMPKPSPLSLGAGLLYRPQTKIHRIEKTVPYGVILPTNAPSKLSLVNPGRRLVLKSGIAAAVSLFALGKFGLGKARAETCQCPNGNGAYYDDQIHYCVPDGITYLHPGNPWGGIDLSKCPFGQRVQEFEPTSNGCGSEGGIEWPYYFWGFVPVGVGCDEHDYCYGNCGQRKEWCDPRIGSVMRQVCQDWIGPLIEATIQSGDSVWQAIWTQGAYDCLAMANGYETAVTLFGQGSYDASQMTLCACGLQQPCPVDQPPPQPQACGFTSPPGCQWDYWGPGGCAELDCEFPDYRCGGVHWGCGDSWYDCGGHNRSFPLPGTEWVLERPNCKCATDVLGNSKCAPPIFCWGTTQCDTNDFCRRNFGNGWFCMRDSCCGGSTCNPICVQDDTTGV